VSFPVMREPGGGVAAANGLVPALVILSLVSRSGEARRLAGRRLRLTVRLGWLRVAVTLGWLVVAVRLGLWEKAQPKLVFAGDVLQVVSYGKTGNADAGIVFLTDSRDPALQVVVQAPPGSHRPVVYPAAVVKSSRHARLGCEFLSFLGGTEAMAVFFRYGFVVPGEGK